MKTTLSQSRKIEGYEVLARLFAKVEHQSAETWKPSTYCEAKAISLRYGVEMEEIEQLYGISSIKTQPSKPPPANEIKVSEAKPIKVIAETLICGSCHKSFNPKTSRQKFCSDTCSARERNRKHRNK
jgi:hypothetical protein